MKTISIKTATVFLFLFLANLLKGQTLENIPAGITKLEMRNMAQANIFNPAEKKGYEVLNGKENLKVSFSGNTMKVESSGAANIQKLNIYHDFTVIEVLDMSLLELKDYKSEKLNLIVKDNAKANGKGDFNELQVTSRGAAYINLEGKAKVLGVTSKDASNVNVEDIEADMATIFTGDVATVRVKALSSLIAEAKDLSKIIYTGKPQNLIVKTKDFARIKEASADDDLNIVTGGAEDTMRLRFGDKKIIVINDATGNTVISDDPGKKKKEKKEMKSVWGGFEIGMSSFVSPQMDFNQPAGYSFLDNNVGKSWFWGLNLMETDIHLVKNKFALTTGFGMNWANYRFGNTAVLVPDVDSLKANLVIDKLSNNRLRVFSLDVPVMLKLAPRKKGAHLAAGVIFSYSPGVKLITESESKGYKEQTKIKDDFNVNPFRATATVRVGYGWLRVFANYSLTPYFDKSAGLDVRNFQAGLTVIPF